MFLSPFKGKVFPFNKEKEMRKAWKDVIGYSFYFGPGQRKNIGYSCVNKESDQPGFGSTTHIVAKSVKISTDQFVYPKN